MPKKLRLDYIRDGIRLLYMAMNEFSGARADYGESALLSEIFRHTDIALSQAEDYVKELKGTADENVRLKGG